MFVACITVRTRRYPTQRFHGGREPHTAILSERVSIRAHDQDVVTPQPQCCAANIKASLLKTEIVLPTIQHIHND